MATIQEVYIALFGRPADPVGLRFYNEATDNGNNLDAVGALTGSDEYLSRFEGQNDVQMINQIFQDLFGRDADAQGLLFYTQLLQSGQASIQDIAIRIIDGATGSDQAIIDAKVAAADLFTASLDEGFEIVAYSGQEGIDFGQSYLAGVTSAATVPTQAQVDAQIAAFVDVDPNLPENQFNFTNAVGEQLVGAAENDAFSGVVGTAGTVNVGDTVNGGAGVDTLNLLVADGATALPAGFSSTGVEIVNVNYVGAAATDTLGALNSSSFAGVQQLWQIDNSAAALSTFASVTVGAGVTAGFRSNGAVAIANTVDVNAASATQATISAAIEGVATASTLDFVGAGVKTINVSGNVFDTTGAAETLTVVSNATNLDAVNISLSGATELTLTGAATAETINLAGSTGGITLDLSGAAANALSLTSLIGGSGNDVLSVDVVDLSAAAATVNGGAGNDTINIDITNTVAGTATALTVTGGAGADTFDFDLTGGVGNLAAAGNAADLAASLITVTDFDGSADVLNINGLTGGVALTLQNTVNGAVAGAADLFAAVTAAAGVTADDAFSLFEFGGNTYIYGETGAASGLDAGDTLIQLTGVDLSDLATGSNFVA